ncbi:ribonuclease Z [Halosquirtibacter xylanolyticus]|uniref:ribonuclease Z n=1 Tax=Halosquirtibacter xylanolyticus TaxID=3374599 RepID=UPI00374A40B5|nr:ribonuclease Z [Prolixibacteraceae bacterium]
MREPITVTILGSGSAVPTPRRNTSAQILSVNEVPYLIDCGEGTQTQMLRYGIKQSRITAVFISHHHGDHILGLYGMLSTFNLIGRTKPLHIYAPSEVHRYFVLQKEFFGEVFDYEIVFHPLSFKGVKKIYEDKRIEVRSFPLKHKVGCCGFLFEEKGKEANIKKSAIETYELSIADIVAVKAGADHVLGDGRVIPNERMVVQPEASRRYVYCTDTAPCLDQFDELKGVDLLYHEATFDKKQALLAKKTGHSTTTQAATVARNLEVKRLILGHFSSRYKDLAPLLAEAKSVFSECSLVQDGETYLID